MRDSEIGEKRRLGTVVGLQVVGYGVGGEVVDAQVCGACYRGFESRPTPLGGMPSRLYHCSETEIISPCEGDVLGSNPGGDTG